MELDAVKKSFSLLGGVSSISSEFLLWESVHNESPSAPFCSLTETTLLLTGDLSVCRCLLKGSTYRKRLCDTRKKWKVRNNESIRL